MEKYRDKVDKKRSRNEKIREKKDKKQKLERNKK